MVTRTPRVGVLWTLAAFGCGLLVGWTDLAATEVQGPVLLLMMSAFVLTLVGGRPAWLIALSVALGIPAAHGIASALQPGDAPTWGILIAIVPALIAAYAGRGVAWLVQAAATALNLDAHRTKALGTPHSALLMAIAGCAAAGLLPVWATLHAREQPITWFVALWWQAATLVGWAAVTPVLLQRRGTSADDSQGVSVTWIARHVATILPLAALHAVGLSLLTVILRMPLGPSGLFGATLWAFAVYLPMDALTYILILTFAWASDRDRLARAAAERSAAVSADLVGAQLEALLAQIQPHFLFNALNAVTVLARRGDAAAAADATETLAGLLRYVLKAAAEATVRLDEELDFTRRYLALEQLRFGDRLTWSIDSETAARDALVPILILQPLVENAVRHGIARRNGGRISITATTEAGELRIELEDNGDGPAAVTAGDSAAAGGIGLSNVRARLLVIYGSQAGVTLSSHAGAGATASVRLPLRHAPNRTSVAGNQ
ncbi:MAG: histidine kinase [Vicinamibacterales bacterium]